MKNSNYPDWVLKQKTKGTAIHKIKDNYYLYKITSRWDKEKKRSIKVTEGLVGKITPSGLIGSTPRISEGRARQISVLEHGMTDYLYQTNKDILEALLAFFPNEGKELFIMALYRLGFQSVLKNMEEHYNNSYLKECLKGAKLDKNSITGHLKSVGGERNNVASFLQSLYGSPAHVLIDQTHIASFSSHLQDNKPGYNSQKNFDPQVNLLLLFSADSKMPLFYRLTAGNIREITSLQNTIQESGLENVILISDKGFFSDKNEKSLNEEKLKYILPLRRNNRYCDYSAFEIAGRKGFDGRFTFNGRIIWYKSYTESNRTLVLFLDDELKTCEQKDYLTRIDNEIEGYSEDRFHEKQHKFGTITIIHNLESVSAEGLFGYYKSRNDVEVAFDVFKNVLDADSSYMQNSKSNEAWILINFLALVMYYRLYTELLNKKMLNKYTPSDILLFLQQVKKLFINGKWITAEITKKSQKIIDLLRN